MIQVDPTDPANYFYLANIYEQNGDYEKAEEQFLKAKEMKPNESTVYTTLAAFYDRQGEFEKTINALNERAQHGSRNNRGAPRHRDVLLERGVELQAAGSEEETVQAGLGEVDKARAQARLLRGPHL
jgi:tetratricopeptide (TPR) repeat protein